MSKPQLPLTRPTGGVFKCGHPRLNNSTSDGIRRGLQRFRCARCKKAARDMGERRHYKRRGSSRGPQQIIPIIDDTFFSRSEFHAPHGNDPKCDLPNIGGCGYSEVRVLNAEGECVRIISVDELNARPGKQWHIGYPDTTTKRSSKRSVKTKNGTPTLPN